VSDRQIGAGRGRARRVASFAGGVVTFALTWALLSLLTHDALGESLGSGVAGLVGATFAWWVLSARR
jgi:hypothetical protein